MTGTSPRSSGRPAVPLRLLLLALLLVATAYVGGFAFEVLRVLRPTATELRGRTSELLGDHDVIAAMLNAMRSHRRAVAARVSTVDDTANVGVPAGELRGQVRQLLDESVAMRSLVERSDVPNEMRLLLASATDVETSTGLSLLEALRASEQGDTLAAVEALRSAATGIDSTAALLGAAQRVALMELLRGEDELLVAVQRFGRWAIAWGLVGALILGVGAWVVHHRLYRPVQRMEAAVSRISDGDLGTLVPVERRDELGTLGEHLNAMTAILRERSEGETRRRESLTERFGRILDESTNEIVVFDGATLRAVQANRGARMNLGYARADIGELTMPAMLSEIGEDTLRAHLEILRRGEQPRIFLATQQSRRDGSTYPAETTLQYSTDGESSVFVTVTEDAGVRERVRELDVRVRDFALREQRLLNGGDLGAALNAIAAMATDALGAARGGIFRPTRGTMKCVACFDASARTFSDGGGAPWEADAESTYLDAPVRSGGNLVGWVRLEPKDGPRRWTAEEHTFAGAVAELVARAIDAQEKRTLELELARVQRMDSIGQLAGGIAHDFNNILTAILGNLEYCKTELKPGDAISEAIIEAEDAARRAADLTRQLLAFARHQVLDARVLDLNIVTHDADRMLRRLIGANIEMRTRLDPALRPVRIAPSQLEQVMVNLVVNARDAMPEGGRITIETRNVTLDAAFAADHPEVVPGEFVELVVSDTGSGMDRATQERVFEPFFTTKQVGKGTGLGLAVCYGIVRQAGGVVTVLSEVGHGARFSVYLPAVEGKAETIGRAPGTSAMGGEETLLVVEDDASIRGLLVRALAARGYHVLQAADGAEAIAVSRAHDGVIDLLLTDVVMPRVSGPETARRLLLERPTVPVIYMSGFTAEALVDGNAPGADAFLSKPFTPEEAARQVRQVLDESRRLRAGGATPR